MSDAAQKRRRIEAYRALVDSWNSTSPESLSEASRVCLTRLSEEERYIAVAALLRTFPADIAEGKVQAIFTAYGWPDPIPSESLLSEAREWAQWANAREIGAIARACVESMEGERLSRFADWVGQRDGAPMKKAANQ